DWHEAFDEQFGQLDEEAVFHDVDDEAVKVFAQAGLHEFEFFPFHELAFGFVGGALGLGGGVGDVMQGFKGENFFFTAETRRRGGTLLRWFVVVARISFRPGRVDGFREGEREMLSAVFSRAFHSRGRLCHTTLFSCDTFFVFRTFTMPAMHRQECLCHTGMGSWPVFFDLRFMASCFSMHSRGRLCYRILIKIDNFFVGGFLSPPLVHSRGRLHPTRRKPRLLGTPGLCYTSMSGSLSLVNLMPVVLAIWHRQECLCHTSLVIAQHILQYPVHDEVGIAADGGSEVSVSWRGEGEVAFIDF